MRTCPDCHSRTKKYGEPTLSPGGFLDQVYDCSSCSWCGVDSKSLTSHEIKERQLKLNQPKQLRLL